jgi:hypothetical protein
MQDHLWQRVAISIKSRQQLNEWAQRATGACALDILGTPARLQIVHLLMSRKSKAQVTRKHVGP